MDGTLTSSRIMGGKKNLKSMNFREMEASPVPIVGSLLQMLMEIADLFSLPKIPKKFKRVRREKSEAEEGILICRGRGAETIWHMRLESEEGA